MADLSKITKFEDLSALEQELVLGAWKVAEASYSPYSKFKVGSVIQARNEAGETALFAGCNLELASWAGTICGERAATAKAVSAGYRQFLKASLITATVPGGSPCGLCRQTFREFGGTEMELLIIQNKQNDVRRITMNELLPGSFGPEHLPE